MTIAAAKARGAECLITSKNGEVFNIVPTNATPAAISTEHTSVEKEENVPFNVQHYVARIAAKAVYMPTIAGYWIISSIFGRFQEDEITEFPSFPLHKYFTASLA